MRRFYIKFQFCNEKEKHNSTSIWNALRYYLRKDKIEKISIDKSTISVKLAVI